MPTYDYRCATCGHQFEATRPMRATNEESCPACGGVASKVFSPVSVAFKGTGFHNTDYRAKPVDPSKPAEKAEPSCPAKSESGGCSGCPSAAAAE